MPSTNDPTLRELMGKIEIAWEERGERELVERLADQHPQYAGDLYAFFDAILSENDPLPPGAGPEAVLRTLEWLRQDHASARQAHSPGPAASSASGPSPPQDLLAMMCAETGKSPTAVAAGMEELSVPLLAVFAQYPQLVPSGARRAFAQRAHRGHGLDPQRIRRKFEEAVQLATAASRVGPYGSPPRTYEELLDRAALSPQLRARWLEYGRDKREGDV